MFCRKESICGRCCDIHIPAARVGIRTVSKINLCSVISTVPAVGHELQTFPILATQLVFAAACADDAKSELAGLGDDCAYSAVPLSSDR